MLGAEFQDQVAVADDLHSIWEIQLRIVSSVLSRISADGSVKFAKTPFSVWH